MKLAKQVADQKMPPDEGLHWLNQVGNLCRSQQPHDIGLVSVIMIFIKGFYKCGGVIPVCCWMLHTQCVLSRHALRQVAPTLQMHVPIEGRFYTVMPSINASLGFKFWHQSNLAEITIIMIGCDNVIEAVIWLIDLQSLTLRQCQPICIWAELEINLSLACLVSSSSLGARTVSLN